MNTSTRVHLRAETKQMRNGKLLLRGDPFTALPDEASDLVAMNFASVVDHSVDEEAAPPPLPQAGRKPQLKKKEVVDLARADDKPQKGRYGRKDLRTLS